MSFLHRFWRRLLSDLGLVQSEIRSYELDENLAPLLQDLAKRERRSEGEIASDLLESAIIQRQGAEENLKRWKRLTRREQEVVALACLGYSNQQIAQRLMISPQTVKTHTRHAAAKFGLRTKSQLQLVLHNWDFSAWDTPARRG